MKAVEDLRILELLDELTTDARSAKMRSREQERMNVRKRESSGSVLGDTEISVKELK